MTHDSQTLPPQQSAGWSERRRRLVGGAARVRARSVRPRAGCGQVLAGHHDDTRGAVQRPDRDQPRRGPRGASCRRRRCRVVLYVRVVAHLCVRLRCRGPGIAGQFRRSHAPAPGGYALVLSDIAWTGPHDGSGSPVEPMQDPTPVTGGSSASFGSSAATGRAGTSTGRGRWASAPLVVASRAGAGRAGPGRLRRRPPGRRRTWSWSHDGQMTCGPVEQHGRRASALVGGQELDEVSQLTVVPDC